MCICYLECIPDSQKKKKKKKMVFLTLTCTVALFLKPFPLLLIWFIDRFAQP